jgi:hypothetical protein
LVLFYFLQFNGRVVDFYCTLAAQNLLSAFYCELLHTAGRALARAATVGSFGAVPTAVDSCALLSDLKKPFGKMNLQPTDSESTTHKSIETAHHCNPTFLAISTIP